MAPAVGGAIDTLPERSGTSGVAAVQQQRVGSGSRSAWERGAARVLLALAAFFAFASPAVAATPLFTFVQISDSQPASTTDWHTFEHSLDTIVAAGSSGALLPQPIDFVLVAGDLVSHASSSSEWVQWVNTVNARLTANGIPYRAIPGNHDEKDIGVVNFEYYIGDSDPWDTDTATFVGVNGRSVTTGWKGLRIIGFNNSNGGYGIISAADIKTIGSKVDAAAAANANVMLFCHHRDDEGGVIPLANVLTNPAIVGYMRGHSGSPGARKGLSGVDNPNAWDLNSNSTQDDGGLLYYEVYQGQILVYVLDLITNPTSLPAPKAIALPKPLVAATASAPTASFSGTPVSGAAPLAVSFTDTSTGSPTGWSWSFGDGGTSSVQNPTHTYSTTGVYDVRLTASNSLGSNTKTLAGYISATAPSPTTTFLPNADARVGLGSPNSNYGSDPELRIRGGTSAYDTYLRFAVSGIASQSVISAKLRLYTNDSSDSGGSLYPVASTWTESGITWNTAPPIGGAPLATHGAAASSQWIEYDVTSNVRGDGTYSFALASASTDSLYFSSREGAHPPQLVLQTGPASAPVAAFGAAPTLGPAPLAVQFSDLSSGGPTSWLWSFGDGGSSTAQNPSHSYANAGVYDVSLKATNALGSNTLSKSAYVQATAPVPPTADFSGTPTSGSTPLVVQFSDLSSGGPTSWLWSFGDGGTSTAQSPSHTYAAAGSFDVSLSATNGAGSNTRVRSAYVSAVAGPPQQTLLPVADARVAAGSPNSNYGTSDTLRLRGGSSAYTSYLRFDLGAVAGYSVVSAKLRLFVTDDSPSGGSAYLVSNAWTETGITWANAPPIGGTALSSAGAAALGTWVEYDVTGAFPSASSVSFALSSSSTNSLYYSSREGANPPQLVVQTGEALPPDANFDATPKSGTAPLSVAFSDLSTGGPTTWLWSFGDGATSTQQSPTHVYASPGTYGVALQVQNAQGTDSLTRSGLISVVQGPPTFSFAPVADAKVSEASPTNLYGTGSDLRVRNSLGGSWQSFLRFNVANLTKPVVRARLRLWVTDASDDGGSVYPVANTWSETSVSWSTAPAISGTPLASLGSVAAGVWVEVDLTGFVTGNGSYDLGLASADTDSAIYSSREGAHPPQLVIETTF